MKGYHHHALFSAHCWDVQVIYSPAKINTKILPQCQPDCHSGIAKWRKTQDRPLRGNDKVTKGRYAWRRPFKAGRLAIRNITQCFLEFIILKMCCKWHALQCMSCRYISTSVMLVLHDGTVDFNNLIYNTHSLSQIWLETYAFINLPQASVRK